MTSTTYSLRVLAQEESESEREEGEAARWAVSKRHCSHGMIVV